MDYSACAVSDDPRAGVTRSERQKLLGAALGFSDLCREAVSQAVRGGVRIDAKIDASLVTNADLAAERAFRDAVEREFPHMGVVGEEFEPARPDAAYQWIIDPVDGTADFARGLPTWGSIIGLFYEGAPLAGVIDHPDLGLRAHAGYGLGAFLNGAPLRLEDSGSPGNVTGRIGIPSRSSFTKRSGEGHVFDTLARMHPDFRVFRTCLTHTYAATGQLDAALEWDANIWDLAATRIIIEEAGGRYVCVRERGSGVASMLYCAVFGRTSLVDRLAAMLAAQI